MSSDSRYIADPPGHCCDAAGRVFRWVRGGWELVPVYVGAKRFTQPYVRLVTPTNSHGKFFKVRDLVGVAWLGPKPSPKHFLHSIGGDKKDVRPCSLAWTTSADIMRRYFRAGGACKLTGAVVVALRLHARRQGWDVAHWAAEAKRLGVTYQAVAHAVSGYSWGRLDRLHPPTPKPAYDLAAARRKVLRGVVVHSRSKLTPAERQTIIRRLANGERAKVVNLSYPWVKYGTINSMTPKEIPKCHQRRMATAAFRAAGRPKAD